MFNARQIIAACAIGASVAITVREYVNIVRHERAEREAIKKEKELQIAAINAAAKTVVDKLDNGDYGRLPSLGVVMNDLEFYTIVNREM